MRGVVALLAVMTLAVLAGCQSYEARPLDAAAHREAFQSMTDVVMDHINELVDPEYRYSQDRSSDGVSGVERFVKG